MKALFATFFALAVLPVITQAHFQLIYTPETQRDRGGVVTLKMPFTHPAQSGHVMDMAEPEEFFVLRRGQKTDLSDRLRVIDWRSAEGSGRACEATVRLKGLGDHVFVLSPAPFYEESEGVYIQQVTKSLINIGTLPTDWDQPLGLKTEIVPLNPPYAGVVGGIFRGIVLSAGQPVPYAPLEVEYMNLPPDLDNNAFAPRGLLQDTPVFSLRADAVGTFSFVLPRAGHWGFAALGVGPDKRFADKNLSQDAVIWVQARELK